MSTHANQPPQPPLPVQVSCLFTCCWSIVVLCSCISVLELSQSLSICDIHWSHGVTSDEMDRPPVAIGGPDQVVQPRDTVTLNGLESKDDKEGLSYNWKMISGNPYAVIEVSLVTECTQFFTIVLCLWLNWKNTPIEIQYTQHCPVTPSRKPTLMTRLSFPICHPECTSSSWRSQTLPASQTQPKLPSWSSPLSNRSVSRNLTETSEWSSKLEEMIVWVSVVNMTHMSTALLLTYSESLALWLIMGHRWSRFLSINYLKTY